MGASHWWYVTSFDTDVDVSVAQLREGVFASHDYVWDSDENDEPRPATIDELLEAQEEEGTHSILDMQHVDNDPDFATLSPLTDEELLDTFGTTTPSHDEAVAWARSGEVLRSPWEGAYVIVRDETGTPRELVISGISGD